MFSKDKKIVSNRKFIFLPLLSKKITIFIAFLFTITGSYAQPCDLTIKGRVTDEGSGLPLSYVYVVIQDLTQGTTTDDEGNFLLEHVCAGEYHLIFSHIGCDPEEVHIHLPEDTLVNIELAHSSISLEHAVVKGKKDDYDDQPNLSVNRQSIEDNTNQNLSGLLENETGVHIIKNGSGIAKPVVHGMYGNRLTILNNGIAQSGQQWGNDHSPEIDPLSADRITVLKGANAIAYGGGNLGSVILIEPKKIGIEPHLHGHVTYAFETNGRGSSLNTRLQQYTPSVAWRVNATLKRYGDKKTADYFLNNTGTGEANFSLQLEKSWKEKTFLDLYASTFNTRLGVLTGSHISNVPDLEAALTREVPFFTEPNFSYKIEAPKQEVSHHLLKLKAKHYIDENQSLQFILAGQLNNREEFDIRRSGRTDIPALSLQQYTFNAELQYLKVFAKDWKLKVGNQNIIIDNTNDSRTGILPLIPDYISWKNGLFGTVSKQQNRANFNIGIRYDYEYQYAVVISNSISKDIIRYTNNFHNAGAVLGVKYDLSKTQSITLSSGYAMRNPAINELYSNGLHQGVSGIEEGDVGLKTEKAIKNTLEYKWLPSARFSLNALAYYQRFSDYIFLNPQDEIRPTIRGAFPVFKYEQTDASIYGFDASTQFTMGKSLFGLIKYSFLRGDDIRNNIPLVYMPPNSLFGSLSYRANSPINLSAQLQLEQLEFELNNRLVFPQNNLLATQDFVVPPPSYNLLGLKMSTNIIFPNYKFRFFTKVDNLFNIQYRDYLNRQRYFADDTGISVTMGIKFKF